MIVASSIEHVSSDWVAVRVSAVPVVLSECTCGRGIAAYHRLGRELIRRARLRGVDMPRRGWRQGRSWRDSLTRPLGNENLQAAGGLLPAFVQCSDCAHRKRLIASSALAGGDRGVVVLMKLVGRTRGLADRGGRREGLVLRGLRAGTRSVSAGARVVEWMRWIGSRLRVWQEVT